MIKRQYYLDKLRAVLEKPIIKVLTGMRRVGKSTLLRQVRDELLEKGVLHEQIIFINFEWLQYESIKTYLKLYDYIKSLMGNHKRYYIFLDEIQEVEGFEKVINSLLAEGNSEIFITGSNSKLLSGELATYLTGRYFSLEVFPLSFKEIYDNRKELGFSTDDSEVVFLDYIRRGGMPGRFDFVDVEMSRNYLSDMYRSILLKDIVARYGIRDIDLLERFLNYILHNISQIFSAQTITNFLKAEGRKLSKETIYHYIDACKSAYLIHSIQRYDLKGKEVMKTNEKYFANDLGIRSLYFDNESDIGQALENVVLLELLRRGYQVCVGKSGEKEVDFVVQKGSEKLYIQVSYLLAEESTIEREFSVLEAIDDNYPKWVLSMDRINRSRNGILHQNIVAFLLSH